MHRLNTCLEMSLIRLQLLQTDYHKRTKVSFLTQELAPACETQETP